MKRGRPADPPAGDLPSGSNRGGVADAAAAPDLKDFDPPAIDRAMFTRVNPGAGGATIRPDALPDWGPIWSPCARRLRSWRVPPRWSSREWLEEMQCEAVAVALVALRSYRPERQVPLAAYLRMRIMGHVLSCYRKEWNYALRLSPVGPSHEPWEVVEPGHQASVRDELANALGELRDGDRWLLDRLYERDETEGEVARALGLTQQAVNKRKRLILQALRHQIGAAWKDSA